MKVLVGIPTSSHKEYCLEEFSSGLKKLTYLHKEILFVDNSPDNKYLEKIKNAGFNAIKGPYLDSPVQRISASRNKIIDRAIKENFDYIFFLDQDTIPPELPDMRELTHEEIFSNQLHKVVSCGGACIFIHKEVFTKIRFKEDLKQCEDRWFCIDLFKHKIPLFCDTSIKCKHLVANRTHIWKDGQLIKKG